MHRAPSFSVRVPRLWSIKSLEDAARRVIEASMEVEVECPTSSTLSRRENSDAEQDVAPRKKSRKSAIMEALLRGADQSQGQAGSSRQMSTVATIPPRFTPPAYPYVPRKDSPSPTVSKPLLSPAGLPFYTHTEALDLPGLPPLPTSNVHYFRYSSNSPNAVDDVNRAIDRMLGRMNPPPDSRWRGVVGFDMEWAVLPKVGAQKTGLIQLSDDKTILLIQISSMKDFPSKLKDLITSSTILKVGVNIGGDMRKLIRDFGPEYAGRGVVELSTLARIADVGLVGTKTDDLDSNRANIGIGAVHTDSPSESVLAGADDDDLDSNGEDEVAVPEKKDTTPGRREKTPVEKRVRPGKAVIQLARLSRRYLGRELEKGEERLSNWDLYLTQKQRGYAANDAHAGLALYHALRSVHARSVSEGVIPVGNPPPWRNRSTTPTMPAPPPFQAKTATSIDRNLKFVPTSELQNLAPVQLDSLLPWSTLIQDFRAEMEDTRAAFRTKRAEEGVDVNGKGEAVIAAEAKVAAAAVARPSKVAAKPPPTPKPRAATTSNATTAARSATSAPASAQATEATKTPTIAKQVTPAEIEAPPQTPDEQDARTQTSTPVALMEESVLQAPSKGMTRVLERRRAVEETRNEVMGRRWPPVRPTAGSAGSSFLTSPLGLSGGLSPPTSRTPLSEQAPRLPSSLVRPAAPVRHATSPVPVPQQQPSSEQLRAYLLWHNRQLSLAQICTTMRSAKRPLTKVAVISHIIDSLRLDGSLPFDAQKLRALVDSDTTDWTREHYREFLERKLGSLDGESQ